MSTYTIRDDITALDFILEIHKGISKTSAKNLIKYSSFFCNGEPLKTIPTTLLKKGQKIEIQKNTGGQKEIRPPTRQAPISIRYEDAFLVVAIKPAGVLSCKNPGQEGRSFDKRLEHFISERDKKKVRLWICHRLDREVEGLLLFAKTERIQERIKDHWTDVTKKYLALTEGKPRPLTGTIENYLRNNPDYKVTLHDDEVPDSKLAKTEYTYVKPVGAYHLIEVTLHTGRKNQIRAHLASIGCPIVGDRKYGADDSVIRQVRLVATLLAFTHPTMNKVISLTYEPKQSFFNPSKTEAEDYHVMG